MENNRSKDMIVIVAKNVLKPGCRQAFLETSAELVAKSRAEDGNIYYDLYEDVGDENVLTFIEAWKNQEAVDIHNASEHFTRIVPRLGEMREDSAVNLYHMTTL